jgi:DNA-binding transcriptional MerR regulator
MLTIGAVAKQTGIDASRLRKWEQRYGFPRPHRQNARNRVYSYEEVALLHIVARRIDAGERIGGVISDLLERGMTSASPAVLSDVNGLISPIVRDALDALCRNDLQAVTRILAKARQDRPLLRFVEDIVAPLIWKVGDCWAEGRLPIYVEHLFSSLIDASLIQEADRLQADSPPRVLLVAPAGERHTLGLSMVYGVLKANGISSMRVSNDLPSSEIVALCSTFGFRAVGLSASIHYPPRLLRSQIQALRNDLPDDISIWLGGAGVARLKSPPKGCEVFSTLDDFAVAAKHWKRQILDHH